MIFRGTKNNFMAFVLKSDKAAGLAWTGTNSSESLTVQNFLSPEEPKKSGVPMRRQNMNLRRNDSIRDQTCSWRARTPTKLSEIEVSLHQGTSRIKEVENHLMILYSLGLTRV